MFRALIERVSELWLQPAAATPPPAAAGLPAPAELAEEAATGGSAPPPLPLAGVGARRPLVSADTALAGFEFRLAEVLVRRAGAAAQTAYTEAVLTAMRATTASGGVALAELPAAWLLPRNVAAALRPGMLICLQQDRGTTPDLLERAAEIVRQAGARVGWPAEPHGAPPVRARPPDFQLLRPGPGWPAPAVLQALEKRAGTAPRRSLVAADLPDLQSVERALAVGAGYASGTLSAVDDPPQAPPLSPQVRRLVELLNHLMRNGDLSLATRDIKGDVGLSLQLLHYVGSARFARGRAVDSVESAVMVVGRDELYRWLSRLLVRSAGGRRTSRALQEVTLARARLLELVASCRGEPHPASLFTLGLASMLPTLLSTSIHQALLALDLVPAARAALLDGNGPWHGHLELARAIERQDFATVETIAQDIGGVAVALDLSEQAWAWALQ